MNKKGSIIEITHFGLYPEQFAQHILLGRQDFNRDAARGVFGEAWLLPFVAVLQMLGEHPR